MAMAGITAVGEFHYVHHQPGGAPYEDPNEMGHSLIRAARRVGIAGTSGTLPAFVVMLPAGSASAEAKLPTALLITTVIVRGQSLPTGIDN
jgi:hypothetical protein